MPVSPPRSDIAGILRILTRHRVDFVVVGGVAATLQGVPLNTFDIDIVHSRDSFNVQRLLAALEELEAVYRIQPERRLAPKASHLSSMGHNLLMTKFGPLDVLGMIGKERTWSSLNKHVTRLTLASDLTIFWRCLFFAPL